MLTQESCRKSKHFAMEEGGQAGGQKQVSYSCSTISVSPSIIHHISSFESTCYLKQSHIPFQFQFIVIDLSSLVPSTCSAADA